METGLFFLVALSASLIGAICGIGGGVVIKPVLDVFSLANVAEASFLSGMTVLVMSAYSVAKSLLARDGVLNMAFTTPLAIGAVAGGIVGRYLFSFIFKLVADPSVVGAVQAALLLVLTLGTLAYNIRKDAIASLRITNKLACVAAGLALGFCSSFIGIGGGPMNLAVLMYFFSMPIKTAARNSLYVIFCSQAANLLWAAGTGTIPPFRVTVVALMAAGGFLGAMIGWRICMRIRPERVQMLFNALLVVISVICVANIYRYW